eukprot:10942877-Lingulodinium_polyedra.AAC.1
MVCDACDLQAAAGATGRFDRIFAQRLRHAVQRCGRIDRSPPRRFVKRALADVHARASFLARAWSAR